jgi:protein-S-isoprenylcysteine O-methyltransferase Ste14
VKEEFWIFLAFFTAGLGVREGYERLKRTGRADPRSRIVFWVVFAGMCMMWMGWFNMAPADPFRVAVPDPVRSLGLGATGLGLVLAVGALVQLRGLENIDHLVTTGLFSRIRHPMYTGFLLWIAGWAAAHGAFLSLAAGTAGVVGILHWRRLEEDAAQRQFGEAYSNYRRQTWF